MAETVNSWQQGAFTSPTTGEALDASVVLGNDNNVRGKHNSHDADTGIHLQSSVLASRPAAGTAGRKWLTSDGLRVYYDTGAAWSEIAYLPSVGGTLTGALAGTTATFSGNVTLANGVYLRGTRLTGALVHNLIGNESGSDRVLLQATGDWVLQNGSTDNNLIITTAGAATFRAGVTATTGTFSGAVTAVGGNGFSNAGLPFSVTNTASAGLNGGVAFRRGSLGGTAQFFIGWDASDNGAILNSAANAANLSWTDAGAFTVRNGLTVTTGGLAVTGNSLITGTLGGITTLTATTGTFSGAVVCQAGATVQAGSASSYYKPALVLLQTGGQSTVSTVDASITSFSLPANALSANGQALRIRAVLSFTRGGAHTYGYNVQFGATGMVVETGLSPASSEETILDIVIRRTGATAQVTYAYVFHDVSGSTFVLPAAPAETLSGAVTIDFRGQVSNAASSLTVSNVTIEHLAS